MRPNKLINPHDMAMTKGQKLVHLVNVAKDIIFKNERLAQEIEKVCDKNQLTRFTFQVMKAERIAATEDRTKSVCTAMRCFVWPVREYITKDQVPPILDDLKQYATEEEIKDLLKLSNECLRLVEGIAKAEGW